jgi:membrane protease YdiL (CAAX protease family)
MARVDRPADPRRPLRGLGMTDAARASTLLAVFAVVAAGIAIKGGHGGTPLVFTITAFVLAALPYVAYVTTSVSRDVRLLFLRQPIALWGAVAVPVVIYGLYALGTGSFAWEAAARVAAFAAVPTFCVWRAGARGTEPSLWDLAAVAAIWLPFDAGWLKSIWTWPAGGGAYIFNTALAVGLTVTLFQAWRGVPGLNVRLAVGREGWRIAALGFLAFLAVALPFGFVTDFIAWQPVTEPARYAVLPLAIFFFIALPEELLFRGLLQDLLSRWPSTKALALPLTAVIFGATHLNNAGADGLPGDWRYFVLATVAGLVYGWIYLRTRRLTAAALTHAAVDAVWVLLLHG